MGFALHRRGDGDGLPAPPRVPEVDRRRGGGARAHGGDGRERERAREVALGSVERRRGAKAVRGDRLRAGDNRAAAPRACHERLARHRDSHDGPHRQGDSLGAARRARCGVGSVGAARVRVCVSQHDGQHRRHLRPARGLRARARAWMAAAAGLRRDNRARALCGGDGRVGSEGGEPEDAPSERASARALTEGAPLPAKGVPGARRPLHARGVGRFVPHAPDDRSRPRPAVDPDRVGLIERVQGAPQHSGGEDQRSLRSPASSSGRVARLRGRVRALPGDALDRPHVGAPRRLRRVLRPHRGEKRRSSPTSPPSISAAGDTAPSTPSPGSRCSPRTPSSGPSTPSTSRSPSGRAPDVRSRPQSVSP